VISTVIGIFYALKDKRKQNTNDFLLGGQDMPLFPVALSLLASFLSAVSILGTSYLNVITF
jgi:sodium-coupled monocarboxylate transporter 8/12